MPDQKKSTLLVVAAIIRKGGKVLIARRPVSSKGEPGRWEFPGGKVEFLEDPKAALVREMTEELGMAIGNLTVFEVTSVTSNKNPDHPHIVIISYLADWTGGEMRFLECSDACFVSLDELDKYDIIDADMEIVKALRERKMLRK